MIVGGGVGSLGGGMDATPSVSWVFTCVSLWAHVVFQNHQRVGSADRQLSAKGPFLL